MLSKLKLVGWLPLLAPTSIVLLVYVAWSVAFLQLGRAPMVSADDPKFMGGISGVLNRISANLVVTMLVFWIFSIIGAAAIGVVK